MSKRRLERPSMWLVFCDLLFNGKGVLVLLYVRELLRRQSQGPSAGVPVDLVLVLDASASMASAIEQLTLSLVMAATLMASGAPDCRIGLVCYRDGVVFEQPLTEIRGEGVSIAEAGERVDRMMSTVETKSVLADLPAGVRRGMQLLGEAHGRRQRLVVLGDVDGREAAKTQGVDQSLIEERLVREVEAWQASGDRQSLWLWSHAKDPMAALFKRMGETEGGHASSNIGELVGWIAFTSLEGE